MQKGNLLSRMREWHQDIKASRHEETKSLNLEEEIKNTNVIIWSVLLACCIDKTNSLVQQNGSRKKV